MELKTDGEPALVDVEKKVKELSEMKILLTNPPAHDPRSNGVAERTVREFKEQLRATKIALERRLKIKISPKSDWRPWSFTLWLKLPPEQKDPVVYCATMA